MKFRRIVFLSFLCWTATQSLAAAVDIEVKSVLDGQPIYVVVSEPSTTHPQAGVYAIGDKTDTLVLSGDILGVGRKFNGLYHQFNFGRRTKQYEALAVRNGKITLFGQSSTPGKKKSIIEIGSQTHPVIDPISGLQVQLPLLKDLHDVQIAVMEGEADQTIIYFSIKGESPFGSGMTGACIVSQGKKAGEVILGKVYVLDYQFITHEQISTLVDISAKRFPFTFSRLQLQALGLSKHGDPPLLVSWKEQIRELADGLYMRLASRLLDETYQIKFNLQTGLLDTSEPIALKLGTNLVPVYQLFDPSGSQTGLVFQDKISGHTRPEIPGFADFIKKDVIAISEGHISERGTTFGKSAVISVNGYLYLVTHLVTGQDRVVFLCKGLEGLTAMAHVFTMEPTTENGHLVLSLKSKEEEKTEYFEFVNNQGVFSAIRSMHILDRFENAESLRARFVLSNIYPENKLSVLFDVLTPTLSPETYKIRHAKTSPYLDLSLTEDTKTPIQSYVATLETRFLLPNKQVVYSEFEHRGADTIKTGVYIQRSGAQDEFILAKMIGNSGFPKGSPLDSRTWDEEVLLPEASQKPEPKHKKTLNTIDVYATQEDPTSESTEEFSILVVASRSDDEVSPGILGVKIPHSLDGLIGVKILNGKRKNRNTATVFLFFEPSKAKTKKTRSGSGGVYAFTVMSNVYEKKPKDGVVQNPQKSMSIDFKGSGWLSKEILDPPALRDRVVPDQEGALYWLSELGVPKESKDFTIQACRAPGQAIYPNRAGSASVRLRFTENPTSEEIGVIRGKASNWCIFSSYDLGARFEWFKKENEEVQSQFNKGLLVDDLRKKKSYFPGFVEYLNQLANPSRKKSERVVVLVEAGRKEVILKQMVSELRYNSNGFWSLDADVAQNNYFYYIDRSTPATELLDELGHLKHPIGNRKPLLFGELKDVVEMGSVKRDPKNTKDAEDDDADEDSEDAIEEQEYEEQPEFDDEESQKELDEGLEELSEAGNTVKKFKIPKQTEGQLSPLAVIASNAEVQSYEEFKTRVTSVESPYPVILIATPEEWKDAQQALRSDRNAKVFDQFKVEYRFLTSPWTLWPPHSSLEIPEITTAVANPISEDEIQVFSELKRVLDETAKSDAPVKHQIVIVPERLRSIVTRITFGLWAQADSEHGGWNYRNSNLATSIIPAKTKGIKQSTVRTALETLRALQSSGKRSVLLGQLENVLAINAPTVEAKGSDKNDLLLSDHAADTLADRTSMLDEEDEKPSEIQARDRPPHLLWLLATEGKNLGNEELGKKFLALKPEIPILLIGTEAELHKLMESDVAFEKRFGLGSHFEVTRLANPSEEVRANLVSDLFHEPEIERLNYQFQLQGLSGKEAKQQVIYLWIHRVEEVARQMREEPTTAFIRAYSALRRALVEDTELRNHRVIDRGYCERLLTTVFPIPISFNSLSPTDPLHKIKDPSAAARELQQMGYEGPLELKERFIRLLHGQTRPTADSSKPIPASLIMIGEQGTGKTMIWEKVIELMGLKIYDWKRPGDETVSAMIVKVQNIVEEEDPSNPDLIPLKDVMAHISNFLALPNGWRGMLLIDDLHKAKTAKILTSLLTFIQAMFEAPKGIMRVTRLGKNKGKNETAEVPMRNVVVGVTLNPQKDRAVRERFVNENQKGSLSQEIVAALSIHGVSTDDSWIGRFGDVLDLSLFPREAKSPALVKRLRLAAQTEFSHNSRLILVTPAGMEKVVNQFNESHARAFLSTATNSMLEIPPGTPEAPIYLVVPRPKDDTLPAELEKDASIASQIEAFVRSSTIVKAIRKNSLDGMPEFVAYLVNGFRVFMINQLMIAAQESSKLSGSFEQRRLGLAPFLLAAYSHIQAHPELSLSLVPLSAKELGFDSSASSNELKSVLAELKDRSEWPFQIAAENREGLPTMEDFIKGRSRGSADPTRSDVFVRAQQQIYTPLLASLRKWFRLPADGHIEDLEEFFKHLPSRNADLLVHRKELLDIYETFITGSLDSGLFEMLHPERQSRMPNTFDLARLYMYAFDRALSELPWAQSARSIVEVITFATSNLKYGQRPGVQSWVFEEGNSPFQTETWDYFTSSVIHTGTYKSIPESLRVLLPARFKEDCQGFFLNPKDVSFKKRGDE